MPPTTRSAAKKKGITINNTPSPAAAKKSRKSKPKTAVPKTATKKDEPKPEMRSQLLNLFEKIDKNNKLTEKEKFDKKGNVLRIMGKGSISFLSPVKQNIPTVNTSRISGLSSSVNKSRIVGISSSKVNSSPTRVSRRNSVSSNNNNNNNNNKNDNNNDNTKTLLNNTRKKLSITSFLRRRNPYKKISQKNKNTQSKKND